MTAEGMHRDTYLFMLTRKTDGHQLQILILQAMYLDNEQFEAHETAILKILFLSEGRPEGVV